MYDLPKVSSIHLKRQQNNEKIVSNTLGFKKLDTTNGVRIITTAVRKF